MSEIQKLEAMEILDSRGNPTLAVTATLSSGVSATAKIPSGASKGAREAIELRDGDKSRYQGKGVLKACAYVEGEIQKGVVGMNAENQAALDGNALPSGRNAEQGAPGRQRNSWGFLIRCMRCG